MRRITPIGAIDQAGLDALAGPEGSAATVALMEIVAALADELDRLSAG